METFAGQPPLVWGVITLGVIVFMILIYLATPSKRK